MVLSMRVLTSVRPAADRAPSHGPRAQPSAGQAGSQFRYDSCLCKRLRQRPLHHAQESEPPVTRHLSKPERAVGSSPVERVPPCRVGRQSLASLPSKAPLRCGWLSFARGTELPHPERSLPEPQMAPAPLPASPQHHPGRGQLCLPAAGITLAGLNQASEGQFCSLITAGRPFTSSAFLGCLGDSLWLQSLSGWLCDKGQGR